MTLRVMIVGQKHFGAEVFDALSDLWGVEVVCVSAPAGDRLEARARDEGLPVVLAGGLNAASMPAGVDLIVAAHSHDFIGERTRLRARFGGIGYHPSLLPLHRGRDAIEWAIRMRERVTGGSVYRLSNRMDGGSVLASRHVFIRPGDTARELWRRDLAPLGVALLTEVVAATAALGFRAGVEQDEALATWEPSIERPPAFRPDLYMLPAPPASRAVEAARGRGFRRAAFWYGAAVSSPETLAKVDTVDVGEDSEDDETLRDVAENAAARGRAIAGCRGR